MKIFIGSSRESLGIVRDVEVWLENNGHEPLPWDEPGLFPPGEQTFLTLIEISRKVDGAIFIFSDDDEVWYRGDVRGQPRDNVLIEYGLFSGALSPKKAIICRNRDPKHSVDLSGLNYIDISQANRRRAKLEISIWSNKLDSKPTDPAIISLTGKIRELEVQLEKVNDKLFFEEGKSEDLRQFLTENKKVDFVNYDLSKDGHWKLLFEYEYFNFVADTLASSANTPLKLKEILEKSKADKIVAEIAWRSPTYGAERGVDRNPQRTIILARKSLRVFRNYGMFVEYNNFVMSLPLKIKFQIEKAAELQVKMIENN